ncbi:hypothetical protein E2C01_098657 [Portunus trituberculatus]|uniref:Uncharacterized protein n=1 Tax=Portunus trituberculatus TaxID=210409 RepID=A0A5B7K1S2_PORTR|nr:hypothetical protein [Portunus trituberculatus]
MFEFTLNRTVLRTPSVLPDDRDLNPWEKSLYILVSLSERCDQGISYKTQQLCGRIWVFTP